MRLVRASDCKVMPWKNGGGTTTEIVVSPEGASLSDFDWRVSMAHVGQDGPFSAFPGIDRTLSVLSGAGLVLAFGDGERVGLDRASAPFPFAADRAVDGLLADGPIDDLNVMSRRGAWNHTVQRLIAPASQRIETESGFLVLVARAGGWRANGTALEPGDAAILAGPAWVDLRAEAPGALFAIRLWPS